MIRPQGVAAQVLQLLLRECVRVGPRGVACGNGRMGRTALRALPRGGVRALTPVGEERTPPSRTVTARCTGNPVALRRGLELPNRRGRDPR